MAVAFSRSEPPASDESIRRLEQRIGQPLPLEYREFLRRNDGGAPDANGRAVNEIFGLGSAVPDYASMWRTLDTYRDRVPTWLLPVASDVYGNLFALSLRPEDRGSVWFWDHELEADEGEPPREDNITRVASGWRPFLDSLEPVDTGIS